MNATKTIFGVLLSLAALAATPALAQTWSKAQTEVWQAVLASYEAIDAGDADWSKVWVLPNAKVWSTGYPMPRGRDSVMRWDKYQFPASKTHVAEYSPAAIVVHDSTAVAHYYYSNATEDNDGKRDTTHGRCTDVLAKEKGKWRFIAWNCNDETDDD